MPTSVVQQGQAWGDKAAPGEASGRKIADLSVLASKQREWRDLPAEDKLGLINEIMTRIAVVSDKGFLEMANKNLEMMGMSPQTPEGKAQAAETAFFSCMSVKQTLFGLRQAYELRTGKSKYEHTLTNLPMKKAVNGQIITQIIPGDPASKNNPFYANNIGEIWFDPRFIKEANDVQPFNFGFFDQKADGAMVVLG